MRVAIIHSFYRSSSPSGENAVVLSQAAQLEKMGNEVRIFAASSDDLSILAKTLLPLNVAFFKGKSFEEEVFAFKPDLIHVHNLFPNIGYLWLTKVKVPIVVTFHNFRPFCANGLLSRNGSPCTDCLRFGSSQSLIHGCYRNSKIKTIPLTIATRDSGRHNPIFSLATKIIVLSEHSKIIYENQIAEPGKIEVLPNFSEKLKANSKQVRRDHWLFVGRLSAEKGIEELLYAWPSGQRLLVYGTGDLENPLKELYKDNDDIVFMGYLDDHNKAEVFNSCKGLVFPSTCFETSPLVMSEAFSLGRPIMAFANNVVGMQIEKFGGGETFADFSLIPVAIQNLEAKELEHSSQAAKNYELHFSPEIWSQRITAIYNESIDSFS